MANIDEPITRFTSVAFAPDQNNKSDGFFVPQLTPQEIAGIPVDEDKIGGIIYNIQTQELQYLAPTLQWVNITSDGGEPVFTDLTATGTTLLNILNVTGATILNSLTVTNDIVGNGTIYGSRLSAGMFNNFTPLINVPAGIVPTKLAVTTTASPALNQFTMPTFNRLQYIGTTKSPINVLVNASFSAAFNNTDTLSMFIVINDTLPSQGSVARITVLSTAASTISLSGIFTLNTNDYLEVWAAVTGGGAFSAGGSFNITVTEV